MDKGRKPNPLAKLSRRFYGFAEGMLKSSPNLPLELEQAEMKVGARDYIAESMLTAALIFAALSAVLLVVMEITLGINPRTVTVALLLATVFAYFNLMYKMFQPKLLVQRKVKMIDKDLLYALRHLLIKLRSGITLFEGMEGIASGNYGQVSKEFEKIIKEISSGRSESDTLEDAAYKNPSLYFRRAIWQISSSMRAGADVSHTLMNIVKDLTQEQKVMIRKYGAELNPYALMYMMVTVIFPTLGIALLIVMSSLTGMAVSDQIFYAIYAFLVFFQYIFMGMIKTRRPAIEV